jgi:protein-disulfide isomerase
MKEFLKVVILFRNRISLGLSLMLLASFAAPGCRAQSSSDGNAPAKSLDPPAGIPLDAKTSRNIEVTLRSKLSIPPDYVIHVGPRSASTTPGFDNLLVSFDLPAHPEHSQKLEFLISADNKMLERIARWDISGDTASLIPAGDRPVRGNPNAKVVLVNFDDLECPYCAKLHSELFPETLNHYKGLVKIVYRDLPIPELHPWAMHAAVDANCLAAQSTDAYWSYVDYLHTHGEDVTGPDRDVKKSDEMLDKSAFLQGEKNKLDATKLSACVAKQDEGGIREELKLSDKLSINQTPTLYINGEVIEGALPEDVLWQAIDRALVAEGVTPPPNSYNQPTKPAATAASGQP